MKGKAALVIGIAAGYVLGARAGRERYEQIREQAAKVWELDPVQKQVGRVSAFGKSALGSVPGAVWEGAKKVTSAAAQSGSVQERANRAASAAKSSAKNVAGKVGDSAEEAQKADESGSTSESNSQSSSNSQSDSGSQSGAGASSPSAGS